MAKDMVMVSRVELGFGADNGFGGWAIWEAAMHSHMGLFSTLLSLSPVSLFCIYALSTESFACMAGKKQGTGIASRLD